MMIQNHPFLELYNIISILGYCIFPVNILCMSGFFMDLNGIFGILTGVLSAFLCAWMAMRVLKTGGGFHKKGMLIWYPIFLFYLSFVIVIVC